MKLKELIENKNIFERTEIIEKELSWEIVLENLEKEIKSIPKSKRYWYIHKLANVKGAPVDKLTDYLEYIEDTDLIIGFYYTFKGIKLSKILSILDKKVSFETNPQPIYSLAISLDQEYNRFKNTLKSNNIPTWTSNYEKISNQYEELNDKSKLKVLKEISLEFENYIKKLMKFILKTNDKESIICIIYDFPSFIDMNEAMSKFVRLASIDEVKEETVRNMYIKEYIEDFPEVLGEKKEELEKKLKI